jgi:uncharacterized protein with HEPN domain
MRDHKLFIKDILSAMESIEKFVKRMDFEGFVKDDKTTSAVIRKLEIIGEATKNLPDRLKERYEDIPWKRMAGMRDRLTHGYFGVDYDLVWEAIKIEIPKVKPKIEGMLDELENRENEKKNPKAN